MRTAIVCLMLLLPCVQVAAGAPAPAAGPIVPVLKLAIQPPIAFVNSSPEAPAITVFDGTASVDKPPVVRCVVTLTSSTDIGWITQVSPSTMVFTSTTPQAFTVTVTVPQGTPTSQGKLLVYGRAVAAGLQSSAEATAIIDVKGPTLLNLTAQNRTAGNSTRASGTVGGGPSNILMYSVLAVVLIAVPAGAFGFYRHRRQRSSYAE